MRGMRSATVWSAVAMVVLLLGSAGVPAVAGQSSRTTAETITHDVTAEFRGVSADGSVQTVSVTVPDALAGSLTVDGASARADAGSASVTDTALVDGPDGDGTSETVAVSVRVEGGGYTGLTVSVSVIGTYPESAGGSIDVSGPGPEYTVDEEDRIVQAAVQREGGTVRDIANAPALLSVSPPSGAGVSGLSLTATRESDGFSLPVPLKRLGGTPSVSVDASTLTFDQGESKTVTVTNDGTAPLSVSGIEVTGNATAFDTAGNDVESRLAAGAQGTITVTHVGSGGEQAALEIRTNATGTPLATVELTGPQTEDGPADDGPVDSNQTDTEPIVETTTIGDRETQNTTVTVRNAPADQEISMNVGIEGSNSTIQNMSITTTTGGNFSVSITRSSGTASSMPSMNTTGKVPLDFFVFEHTIPNDQITEVGMTVRVSRERIDAIENTEPPEVALYRHAGDRWSETNTTYLGSTETHHRYQVTADGYSEWATAAKRAAFEITRSNVNVTKITAGEGVTVSTRISNTGEADGEFVASLWLDDVRVRDRSAEIPASGTIEINFERALQNAGVYEVRVNNLTVDQVNVTGTNGNNAASAGGSGNSNGGDSPPLLLVGGVLALLVGLGITGYLVRSGSADQ